MKKSRAPAADDDGCRVADRPALDDTRRIERAGGGANVEIPERLALGLFGERQDFPHLVAVVRLGQFATD